MGKIEIINIDKFFGKQEVLKQVQLSIQEGEFFTFLGPSGCGKTTLLRILAGFEQSSQGKILVDGKDISGLPPEKRNISMVFQNYALFPHMSVFDNIAYGLKVRKVPMKQQKEQVNYYLHMVGMEAFRDRKIGELSGGEQQRVCIARALIVNPQVLLLDEPLSNLDAKLRDKMRAEIRNLQKKLRITTIFVTHDQKEAMSISDRIAVFHQGKVLQVDEPRNLYDFPKNEFVAQFIEESNVILKKRYALLGIQNVNTDKVSVRPQNVQLGEEGVSFFVEQVEFNGKDILYHMRREEMKIRALLQNTPEQPQYKVGDELKVKIPHGSIVELED